MRQEISGEEWFLRAESSSRRAQQNYACARLANSGEIKTARVGRGAQDKSDQLADLYGTLC